MKSIYLLCLLWLLYYSTISNTYTLTYYLNSFYPFICTSMFRNYNLFIDTGLWTLEHLNNQSGFIQYCDTIYSSYHTLVTISYEINRAMTVMYLVTMWYYHVWFFPVSICGVDIKLLCSTSVGLPTIISIYLSNIWLHN